MFFWHLVLYCTRVDFCHNFDLYRLFATLLCGLPDDTFSRAVVKAITMRYLVEDFRADQESNKFVVIFELLA